jgi:DNA-binding CsgD family transcriptional regulator
VTSLPEQDRTPSLLEISCAPDFFGEVRRRIEEIAASGDEIELADRLRDAVAALGADASYFMTYVREDRGFHAYRLLQACDPLWGLAYGRAQGYVNDPWLEYAMDHSEPIRGSEIACTSESQCSVVQLAEAFGFRSVVVVPAPAGSGLSRLGLLVLGSRKPGFFDGDGYGAVRVLVCAVAMQLHERCAAFVRRELIADRQLNAEEIALLCHERAGRSSKTIARLMGTTPGAIDMRFVRLNAKLRSPNRTVSAKLASEYGLIQAWKADKQEGRSGATRDHGPG